MEQQHLSYNTTRASGYSEALGTLSSKRRLARRVRRQSDHNHIHTPVEMSVPPTNPGHIGSSDAPLCLSSADSTARRRGKSQDNPCPPPRYDGLGVKSYMGLTVLQSLLERMKSRYGSTTTKSPWLKTILEDPIGGSWQIRYLYLYV